MNRERGRRLGWDSGCTVLRPEFIQKMELFHGDFSLAIGESVCRYSFAESVNLDRNVRYCSAKSEHVLIESIHVADFSVSDHIFDFR